MTIEIPDLTLRRLEALSVASGKSVDELAREALESFAGSLASRRAIRKARHAAAKAAGTACSLADLGWLDGYAGQTVDELLSYEGADNLHSILSALEQAIEEKIRTKGKRERTGVERMVLSIMALVREVNNGGYDQFFLNSSGEFAPAIVDDLVRIGCPEVADITQRALDARELPERDRLLQRCDVQFHERTEIPERLFSYVKAHPDGIRI